MCNITRTLGEFSIRDVSFEVRDGEYFILLGASGVGKTVLLETIAGLLKPDRGSIFLDDKDITSAGIQNRHIGLVYQDQALFPHLSVRGNIAYGLKSRKLASAEIKRRTERIAEDVGVRPLLGRRPESLSGGEAQRVALARTLAIEPRCCLLDEPISSLDTKSKADIRALLRKLNRAGHTIVHVTHDFQEAISLASRIAVMENGTIAQVGPAEEVFRRPKSEFVARFIGIRNFFKGNLRGSGKNGLREFNSAGPTFHILTEAESGPGYVMVRSEDITLAETHSETSARNSFTGTVTEVAPARLGVEVLVDVGVEISALVTRESVRKLGLEVGKRVWVDFKASALEFIGE